MVVERVAVPISTCQYQAGMRGLVPCVFPCCFSLCEVVCLLMCFLNCLARRVAENRHGRRKPSSVRVIDGRGAGCLVRGSGDVASIACGYVDTDMQGRGFEWSSGEGLGTGVHLDRGCEAANSLSAETHDATGDVTSSPLFDPVSPRSY